MGFGSTSLSLKIILSVLTAIATGMVILALVTSHEVGGMVPAAVMNSLYLFYAIFGLLWIAVTGLFVGWVLRRPSQMLAAMARDVEAIAQGHLLTSVGVSSNDQIGALATGMAAMTSSLSNTLSDIIIVANRLFAAGSKLDENAGRFAANAGEQSEMSHQIAAAAEVMAKTIDELADNASTASRTSSKAMEIARGGKCMAASAVERANGVYAATSELAATVERLNTNIQEIGDFVKVIAEIADQTNLLALNASIEAARSGEHGRGFAVVANEVRNLAARTKDATTHISDKIGSLQVESARTAHLMEASSAEVSMTTKGISQLGQSLDQILDAFQSVNEEVSQMAVGIEGQSATTHQVTTGIDSTTTLSSEVGKMAGEVALEVKNLRGIADQILVALGTLRLESHDKTRRIVETIAISGDILTMERTRQEACLRQMARSHPYIELLYVTDERGRQVTSNIAASSNLITAYQGDGYQMDWSDRSWFLGAKSTGKSHVTDLYLSAATNTFCYTVACILRDANNRILGVLGADINFQTFHRMEASAGECA